MPIFAVQAGIPAGDGRRNWEVTSLPSLGGRAGLQSGLKAPPEAGTGRFPHPRPLSRGERGGMGKSRGGGVSALRRSNYSRPATLDSRPVTRNSSHPLRHGFRLFEHGLRGPLALLGRVAVPAQEPLHSDPQARPHVLAGGPVDENRRRDFIRYAVENLQFRYSFMALI